MLDDIVADLARQRGYSDRDIAAGREADLRRERLSHPKGRFDEDGGFYLAERRACCEGVRPPSWAHPHTEMLHGRSLTHIAYLFDAPTLHVRRLARAFAIARAVASRSDPATAQLRVRLQHVLKPVASRR